VIGSQMVMLIGPVHAEQHGTLFQRAEDAPAAAKFGTIHNALSLQADALNGLNISTGTKIWIKLQRKQLHISISLKLIPCFKTGACNLFRILSQFNNPSYREQVLYFHKGIFIFDFPGNDCFPFSDLPAPQGKI
jgi:hypothetical protein